MIRLRKNPIRIGAGFKLFVWPAFCDSGRAVCRAFGAAWFVLVTDRFYTPWTRKGRK